jgi:hypothetical protein
MSRSIVTLVAMVGIRAMLVHALNDRALQLYEHYGFKASPIHPMTLMVRISPKRD